MSSRGTEQPAAQKSKAVAAEPNSSRASRPGSRATDEDSSRASRPGLRAIDEDSMTGVELGSHLRQSKDGIVRYNSAHQYNRYSAHTITNSINEGTRSCGCGHSLLPPMVLDVERHDCVAAYIFAALGAPKDVQKRRVTALLAIVRGLPFEAYSVFTSLGYFIHLFMLALHYSREDDQVHGITVTNGTVTSRADEMHWFMVWNLIFGTAWFLPLLGTMHVPLARYSLRSFTGLFTLYNVARWLWAFSIAHTSSYFIVCKPRLHSRASHPPRLSPAPISSVVADVGSIQSGISVVWVCADALQIRRYLKLYAGFFVSCYWGGLMVMCSCGWGYEARPAGLEPPRRAADRVHARDPLIVCAEPRRVQHILMLDNRDPYPYSDP